MQREISTKELLKLYANTSVPQISKHFNISVPTIYKLLKECEKKGLVKLTGRKKVVLVD